MFRSAVGMELREGVTGSVLRFRCRWPAYMAWTALPCRALGRLELEAPGLRVANPLRGAKRRLPVSCMRAKVKLSSATDSAESEAVPNAAPPPAAPFLHGCHTSDVYPVERGRCPRPQGRGRRRV